MSLTSTLLDYFFVQNLALVFGLGLSGVVGARQSYRFSLYDVLFISVLFLCSLLLSWGLSRLVVDFLGFGFLQTLALLLVLVILIRVFGMFANRLSGSSLESLSLISGPLGAGSAAMGLMVLVNGAHLGFVEALVAGVGAILGYGAALALQGGIMRRMELEWIPPAFRGVPFALISLGFVSLVFSGISSLLLSGIR